MKHLREIKMNKFEQVRQARIAQAKTMGDYYRKISLEYTATYTEEKPKIKEVL
jgi:hypothetical protein